MLIPGVSTNQHHRYLQCCNQSVGLYIGLQVVTVLFGDMVCTTVNMDQSKRRKEVTLEIRKKIINKHVKGKWYKTISKQLMLHDDATDVPVTTVAHVIQTFKIQGTVANLPGRGRRRKIDDRSKRWIIRMVTKEPRDNQGGHHCWKQIIKKPDWSMPNYMSTSHKASGRMSCGQMRQKLHFLPRHISSMLTDGKMKHIKKRTLSLLWNMGEARLCSGAVLLHLAQGVLNLCRVQWNLKTIKGF